MSNACAPELSVEDDSAPAESPVIQAAVGFMADFSGPGENRSTDE